MPHTQTHVLPAQVVFEAVTLQMEAVGLSISLLIGAGRDDGFSSPLAAQRVRAGAKQDAEAVLLGHALQEAPQSPMALVSVTVICSRYDFSARQRVLRAQGTALLKQATVLSCFQTLVLISQRKRGH